ncbi:MAG TPA: Maf family protein [Hyphomicrobiaceae bacterium]|nr:Maf family protein [Hyphomicrobiaceae bacterium]
MAEPMRPRLVLASGSRSRRDMLQAAGLDFEAVPSTVDEDAAKHEISSGTQSWSSPIGFAAAVAERLAREKAREVSARHPGAVVIGADQTLALLGAESGKSYSKPAGIAEARRQLAEMRGRTHVLVSAVAVVRDGKTLWSHRDEAHLTMREFSDAFLDDYLARAGEKVCTSVGAYQLEGLGIQLFESITGDYFTILGMPLLALLGELRRQGVVAT